MADVRVICAIGRSGQLGLGGQLPWEGQPERVFTEDVERFFEITRGHVLIAGPKTVASFPSFARNDRVIVEIRSSDHPEEVLSRFPDRVVYVGGGPAVWDVYAPYVRHWDINTLPYDGEADTWFNPAWLVAAGNRRG
ncbi:dihydrofolate reductase [Aurantimonas sp. C2-5-R2]|uniref:dihydrofolate reductase n=1 Tax=unclassified Aurantimonas TaxID=2638230 RepID=UPI002E16F087|nr:MULTISPECIES: dihydrofolate reductase [unclassified Aurantimonas]MEC5290575.1 dihydrofolate reductase [Aurantimonas sp. C2-3-R2]MEC5411462.1 dihydrofolate reductase [Aurantimonas sp. C2-4-R8]